MSKSGHPTDKQLFSIFFGEQSRFAKTLMSKLEVDYELLLEWLHDIFLQAVYQSSPSNLYMDKRLKSFLLLNEGGSYGTWEQLATVDHAQSTIPFGRWEDCCYEELQAKFNKISMALTISNRNGEIEIVVDDDKVFLEKIQSSKRTG